jgi:trigger factor
MELSKLKLEELSPVRKRIEVEIPAGTVQSELDRAFAAVGRAARLRGFRPGKAPRPVLERVFGERVRRDVLERLIGESLKQALDTHRLAVVGMPDVEAEGLTPGQALRYAATIDVRPVIEVRDLSGLEAVRPTAVVSDAEVDEVLESLRQSVAQLRPIEGRTIVEAGDVVTVDVTSRVVGGEPVRREGVMLEAGAGSFPAALERLLVGQPLGARRTFDVTYPADHPRPALAGKRVHFDVEVKEIRLKELPPLDDDFARDHGRCETLAELRARIRADLEERAAQRAEEIARAAIVDQLIARHPFEVPPSLVERRIEAWLAGLDVKLAADAAEREAQLERLRAELRPGAERDVRAELVLEAVAAYAGITVSEDDVAAEIAALAAREGRAPERVRAFYERPEARAALRARLVRERALAHVMRHATIVSRDDAKEFARTEQSR